MIKITIKTGILRMKNLKEVKKFLAGFGLFALLIGGTYSPALAVPIIFHLGFGGEVTYEGGATPLVTTDGTVESIDYGSESISLTDGVLNFKTGNKIGEETNGITFTNVYDGGGQLVISGSLTPGGAVVDLITGDFIGVSNFHCCSGLSASFEGLLNITDINADLAAQLGVSPTADGGSIGQTEFFFGATPPTGAGVGFSATQAFGSVTVSAVPEPTSLLLLGSGLLGLAAFGKKKIIRSRERS